MNESAALNSLASPLALIYVLHLQIRLKRRRFLAIGLAGTPPYVYMFALKQHFRELLVLLYIIYNVCDTLFTNHAMGCQGCRYIQPCTV